MKNIILNANGQRGLNGFNLWGNHHYTNGNSKMFNKGDTLWIFFKSQGMVSKCTLIRQEEGVLYLKEISYEETQNNWQKVIKDLDKKKMQGYWAEGDMGNLNL